MLASSFVLAALVAVSASGVLAAAPPNDFSLAVDVSVPLTQDDVFCLKGKGYKRLVVQIFNREGNGSISNIGIQTLLTARIAGMATDVYVTPNLARTGGGSAHELYEMLERRNLSQSIGTMWLQVTDPLRWNVKSNSYNLNFIHDFFQDIFIHNVAYGVGVLTSWHDWQQIVGNGNTYGSAKLWYWSTLGDGAAGETVANFDDFRPFSTWLQPAMKQFGQTEIICNVAVNRNVVPLAM